jgi:hypothetical protein
MINSKINTRYLGNCDSIINNVHLFTQSVDTSDCSFNSATTGYTSNSTFLKTKKNNTYSISLDWFQFICKFHTNTIALDEYKSDLIQIEKYQRHNNPNFKSMYKIYYNGIDVLELYTTPINNKHKIDEMSCKLSNAVLYMKNWTYLIDDTLELLNIELIRLNKIAIALDGNQNMKILNLLRRYLRTKTIQINNNKLEVTPKKFIKDELKWLSFTIGTKHYQKFARVYDKVQELKISGKSYIIDYWIKNNIDIDSVARFEIELGSRHLKKYEFSSIHEFNDARFLSRIFFAEVSDWLKIYQVKLNDIKSHRKDVAIKKGTEIQYIKWNELPDCMMPLDTIPLLPNEILNAKKSITFALREIRSEHAVNCTSNTITYIHNITNQYNLHGYTQTKINFLFKDIIPFSQDHPIDILLQSLKNELPLSIDIDFAIK